MKRSRLVLVLVVGALLFGCSKGDGYPPEVVQNFMTACTAQSGATQAKCRCAIDRLQEQMTFEEYREFEAGIQAGGQTPTKVTDIIAGCVAA